MFAAMYHFRKLSKVRIFASFFKKKVVADSLFKDRGDISHLLEINDKMLLKFSEFGIWNMSTEFSPMIDKLEKILLPIIDKECREFSNDSEALKKMINHCLKMEKQEPGPKGMERLKDSLIFQGCLDFRQLVFFRAFQLAYNRILLDTLTVDDRRVSAKLSNEMNFKVMIATENILEEDRKREGKNTNA